MPAALSLVSVALTFAMMAAESADAASCASAACWSTPPRALAVGAGGVKVAGLPVIESHETVATP